MKPFEDVKASDLMQKQVVTLRDSAPISEAIETFEDERISGAPVTDPAGNTVGVLSAFDIAHTRHLQRARISNDSDKGEYDYGFYEEQAEEGFNEDAFSDKENYSPQLLGRDTVADWMNPKVIAVTPDTSVSEACTIMAQESIHRVLVMKGKEICGILSTFDVVRYIANAK